MATTADYIEFVAAQAADCGGERYRKMFGEYKEAWRNGIAVILVAD
jgi:TfoX/Sxy family transcriptional regulator of competence genes